MKTFFWDFFGPNAEPTAKHFLKHLDAFVAENGLEGCQTGLASSGEGHQAAFCRTPEAHQPGLLRALRPRRFE
jgi:hypothetical protein